jgi:Ran GTPase-activating protein (RanGAP) involved in mRNA processing and transport
LIAPFRHPANSIFSQELSPCVSCSHFALQNRRKSQAQTASSNSLKLRSYRYAIMAEQNGTTIPVTAVDLADTKATEEIVDVKGKGKAPAQDITMEDDEDEEESEEEEEQEVSPSEPIQELILIFNPFLGR